jgi:hypothetical protein
VQLVITSMPSSEMEQLSREEAVPGSPKRVTALLILQSRAQVSGLRHFCLTFHPSVPSDGSIPKEERK